MAAAHKIKEVAKSGVKTIKAAKGNSDHAAELRRQLDMSAGLAVIAGVIGFLALRAMRCAGAKADEHLDWKSRDSQLDDDLADSLDASDAVAKY